MRPAGDHIEQREREASRQTQPVCRVLRRRQTEPRLPEHRHRAAQRQRGSQRTSTGESLVKQQARQNNRP